jgi:putative AdoMet-dependent methyltransferase
MLDDKGFDLWADGYDISVKKSDRSDQYPFSGYKDVLNEIYKIIRQKEKARVLDIGFGTGVLAKKLYDNGYEIHGVDFSGEMIKIAKEKMPNAVLIKHDFSHGLPNQFQGSQFDFVISTYALHHLTDKDKARLLNNLLSLISEDGLILIGDIAFETRAQLNACKKRYNTKWDEDEIYFVFEEIKKYFTKGKIKFHKISFCSGIISLWK